MPHAKPRLLVVRGPCRGQELVVSAASVSVGRGPDNDLALRDDLSVSRHHLTVTLVDGGVRARDSGSENGTLLNGEPLEGERLLRHGDELEMGESVVRLVHSEPVGLSVPFVKTRKPPPNLAPPLMLAAGAGALVAAWFVFGSGADGQKPRAPDAPPIAAPATPPPVVVSLPLPDAPPPPVPAPPRPRPAAARPPSSNALARAEAFLRDGKLVQARAACDIAERSGADVTRIRTSLEAAAARLFAEARQSPGADGEALYRRILRVVPPSSQWHHKALAALGESP